MPIEFQCASCGKKLRAPDTAAGKRVKCPTCAAPVQVPDVIYDAEEAASPGEEEIYTTTDADAAPQDDRRPCPMCGEMIKRDAAKCRFCGEVFDEDLRRADRKKKRRRGSAEDQDLAAGDWVVAVLCAGIGCIMGIVWMIQGKPKGAKMFGVSICFVILWNLLNVLIQLSMKR